MPWFRRFYDPIVLPDGRELLTLRDAAEYITHCRKPSMMPPTGRSRWKRCCWSPSATGPEMLARIAVMRALKRDNPKASAAPRKKSAKVFRKVR
jgi:hypothetical protein